MRAGFPRLLSKEWHIPRRISGLKGYRINTSDISFTVFPLVTRQEYLFSRSLSNDLELDTELVVGCKLGSFFILIGNEILLEVCGAGWPARRHRRS